MFLLLHKCVLVSDLYWAAAGSSGTAFVSPKLWDSSTSPLLLVVFEGRVPFSTSGLYQPQLWNPRFALDTSLSQEGKHGDVGKTVAKHKGKECDGRKWDWFTPTMPQGMDVIGLCNLSSVKVQWGSEESFNSGDSKAMVLWWKGELSCCIWQDEEQMSYCVRAASEGYCAA